jgi:tRNA dimethylallyltransferase
MQNKKHLLIIAGPTAVGKTALSIQLAKHFSTEIISADSRQIYKELSIGTAKPSLAEQDGVKHHFVDHISIHQNYTAGDFEREAIKKLEELFAKHDLVIMCGGSGLFIDAVCNGFDEGLVSNPETKKKINEQYESKGVKGLKWLQDEVERLDPKYFETADICNPHRLMRALEVIELSGFPFSDFRRNKKAERDFNVIKVLVNEDRDVLYEKINRRVDVMMKQGLLQEAESVYAHKNLNALNTVGYKELFEYLDKEISLEKAIELIKQHSRNYAKRQLTWFRKNNDYEVFAPQDLEKIKAFTEIILQNS